MKINFRAIVDEKKLPTSAPLLPLFEAIVNSIQSIDEAKITDGLISINVVRDVSPLDKNYWETDVYSFEITDNGIGFNDKNYASFDIYGSDYKLAAGCKGVGRVQWLRAFSKVVVDSTYLGDDGKLYDRKFDFSIADERKQLEHHESEKKSSSTKVILEGFFPKYKKKCPKRIDTLARDIMNHCFTYLALGTCPKIIIQDEQDSVCVNSIFREHTKEQIHMNDFTVNGVPFSIVGAKNYASPNGKNILHYCAHKRDVSAENENIREINGKLVSNDGEFVYCGYITGALLDTSINSERTAFTFVQPDASESETEENGNAQLGLALEPVSDEAEEFKRVTKQEIADAALVIIREFLKEEISAYAEQKKDRIEHYVYSKNPRYRSLLKHNGECIERIPLTADDDKLELELFKQEQAYRLQLKREQSEVLEQNISGIEQPSYDYDERSSALLQKLSDLGKDDLSEYITHRKVMLDILIHALSYADEEKKKYALEKHIHNLVFPMTTTSDDIEYDKHNLWIIDEKLAYHYYLASDKSVSTYDNLEGDSKKEPDIAIFEPAFALTGDAKDTDMYNVTIIEFKRPGRTDKECVDQVVEYMDSIREGRAKDKTGRILCEVNGKLVRFYCYILCDVSAAMSQFLERRGFKKTPDGKGYYWPLDTFNATIEVIPYSKLITDSIRRNKILFDKLFNQ
ncbi:hypothetical protein FACS189499_04960 [Clostridia bacterium]|nr:hypothetical protein FACS189499_04960 [Clostridia bacterium]